MKEGPNCNGIFCEKKDRKKVKVVERKSAKKILLISIPRKLK